METADGILETSWSKVFVNSVKEESVDSVGVMVSSSFAFLETGAATSGASTAGATSGGAAERGTGCFSSGVSGIISPYSVLEVKFSS